MIDVILLKWVGNIPRTQGVKYMPSTERTATQSIDIYVNWKVPMWHYITRRESLMRILRISIVLDWFDRDFAKE